MKDELEYWRTWLATEGGQYRDEYGERLAPDLEVDDAALRDVLDRVARDEPMVLDVGAGPCSSVGSRFNGRSVAVTAVDPLAAHYDRLLAEAGVAPRVRTQVCSGEDLIARFGRDSFDVVYARNAIDHSVDPIRIIEQMICVVRPGGSVVLRHGRNEALKTGYVQLHRWNFDCRDGRFVVWRPRYELDVQGALGARAEVHCHLESADEDDGSDVDDPGWIVCDLRKGQE